MLCKLIFDGDEPELEEAEGIRFASLPFSNSGNALEDHLEDLLAQNVNVIEEARDNDTESLLVIGRQVVTNTGKRMDLVALNNDGALILIEVKRDAQDVKAPDDHAEIQSVRYAASLATLKSQEDLVTRLYGPYIQKFGVDDLRNNGGARSPDEWARKKLGDFIRDNDINSASVNSTQKIVLIGAAFDSDTKSAAAWMAANGLPIRMIEVRPHTLDGIYYLNIEQIIPVPQYKDFYVDVTSKMTKRKTAAPSGVPRKSRLRLADLFDAGKVKAGDDVWFSNARERIATLTTSQKCTFEGKEMSLLAWTKEVSGWSAVNIYEWVKHGPSDRLLEELRVELESDVEEKES